MKGVNTMPKKKYSDELKLEIVEKYLKENASAKRLAKEYYIGSEADIKKWVAMYEHHGVQGLCTVNGSYAGNFKVYVVQYANLKIAPAIRKPTVPIILQASFS